MNIIHLLTSLNVGGTEKFLLTLVQHQVLNHQLEIIVMKEEGTVASLLRHNGFQVSKISSLFRLYSHLKNKKVDILHTHLFRANIIGRIIGTLAGVNIIVSSQQSIDAWKKPWHWWIERFSARYVHRIIANSYAAKNALIHKGGIPENKIYVSYIGIDLKTFKPTKDPLQIYEELHIPHEKKIVAYIGRLHREKGSHYIPGIIEKTISRDKKIIFLIIGTGPLQNYVKKNVGIKKLSEYVIMLDERMDVANIMNASSVFFLPSCEESFANAALEAMAMAKPVVITDVGGNRELVETGIDGFLVPPHNPEAVAERILELLSDTDRASAISINARKKAETFDMDETLKTIDAVYHELTAMGSK